PGTACPGVLRCERQRLDRKNSEPSQEIRSRVDPSILSLTRLAPGRLHRRHDHAMTTAALTPEKEVISSQKKTPTEQQASMLAIQQDSNPFLDTRRAWNGVWEESLANARRWRLIALFEAGLLALALFGLIHLGSQPKAIPYVIEVNKLG